MKRLFNIFLMALLSLTAMAQDTETRHLRVKVLPKGAFPTMYLTYYDYDNSKRVEIAQTDISLIEAEMPVGKEFDIVVPSTNGYVLKQWTENGQLYDMKYTYNASNNMFYKYKMPDKDVELVALYEYNLDPPTYQPGAGSWDPETGTLICDNGPYSSTTYSIPGFNYNEDRNKVITYVLGNIGGTYGVGVGSQFPNCVTIDLSRTTIESMGSLKYSKAPTTLKEVILPSTLTSFPQYSMDGVQLQTLICYAMTPPELYKSITYNPETGHYDAATQKVFLDCPDMVVRVPAEAVPLYQAADGWKDFTIVAMDEGYANLSVNLMAQPDNKILEQFKDMTLHLTNLGSGQVRRLLVTGRNNYEFRYLPQNTNYRLSLQDNRGSEAASVDDIFVGEQNQQVTLSDLKLPNRLSLTLTADGKPVDGIDYTTTWLTVAGNYISRGTEIDHVFDNQRLLCVTTLGSNLAQIYQQPDTLLVTVSAPYDITLPLKPLEMTTATFTVVDSLTNRGIDKAVIQVMQQLPGGETGASTTLTTATNGVATGKVLAALSTVIVTSPSHGSKTLHLDLAEQQALRISFLPANGTSVQVSHTFKPAVAEGEAEQLLPAYTDARSLEYTFTATLPNGRDSVITEYLTNNQLYTFYSDLPQGTRLHVGVTSAKDDIEPVGAEVTVGSDNTLNVLLPLVERGSIVAKYMRTESNKPALLVIDKETGQVVRRMTFDIDEKAITISNLPQGDYVIAVLSKGTQFAGISTLEQLEQYAEDEDYVSEEVSVSDGQIVQTSFYNVPLCTKQLDTNLSSQRARFREVEITLGNNANISVLAHFANITTKANDGYGDPNLPTDCKLEMVVPEGFTRLSAYRSYRKYITHNDYIRKINNYLILNYCTIDEVMKSDNPSSYMADDLGLTPANTSWNEAERKLTIDWPHINEGGQMSLSMLPSLAGTFKPEMYLTYTLHGKKYREMLETNEITVSRSGIKVPETIINPSFVATGYAMYIDESELNNTTEYTKANGPKKAGATSLPTTRIEPKYYEVTVMDGDQPIGKAQINAEGKWQAQCKLVNPYALSKHNIYAVIKYKNGFSYQTEASTVTYDPYAVVPLNVKMSFFNHHPVHLVNTVVNYNFKTGSASPTSYGFDLREGYNTDFTFEINLSNNDTTKVYAVDLTISTQGPDAEEFTIPAHYNARKNRWIAYDKFNTRSLPYTVDVKPYYHHDIIGSHQEIEDIIDMYNNSLQLDAEVGQLRGSIDQKLEEMQAQVNAGNGDAAEAIGNEIMALLVKMSGLNGITIEAAEVVEEDEVTMMPDIDKLLNELTYFEGAMGDHAISLQDIGNLVEGVTVGPATGMTEVSLLAAGYEEFMLDNGSKLFIRTQEDNSLSVVSLIDNLVYTYSPSAANAARRMASLSWNDIKAKISEFHDKLNTLNEYVSQISNWCDVALQAIKVYVTKLGAEHSKILKWYQITQNSTKLNAMERAAMNLSRLRKLAAINAKTALANKVSSFFSNFKVGDGIGTLGGLVSLVSDYLTFNKEIDRLVQLNNSLPSPCPEDQKRCDQLSNDIMTFTNYSLIYNTAKIAGDLISVGGCLASLAGCASIVAAPEGLAGLLCSLTLMGLNYAGGKIYEARFKEQWNYFVQEKSQLRCNKKKKRGCTSNCGGCKGGGCTTPILDPSGYVYEGVPSNRVEGVTATVFYKQIGKNQFGDDVEKVMVWDAERFAQENPQFTDENGEYGWMVPAGLWQVKYEKQGYQTEYSEWLPVPPPQLDVNQAMVQFSEPQVSGVKATTQMVQVNFDKYMMADSLTTNTIFVAQGGKKVNGDIDTMIDDEDPMAKRLTNKARFLPATQLPVGQTLTLTVKRNVTSYAGVQMNQDFSQEFDIKADVLRLETDSVVHVIYDQQTELTIYALPASAAAGKKVRAKVLSDMIATADATELTFDAEGKAVLTLTGEASGTTAVVFQLLDDSSIEAVTIVMVRDEDGFICPMPEANYVDGIELTYGMLIELTCEVPEAVIYYTLDGTCPCDSKSAMRYEGPIALTGEMTLKAYAVAPGYADSDIAEYSFFLNAITETTINNEPMVRKGVYDLQGRKLSDGTDVNVKMKKGIYIINGEKVVVR